MNLHPALLEPAREPHVVRGGAHEDVLVGLRTLLGLCVECGRRAPGHAPACRAVSGGVDEVGLRTRLPKSARRWPVGVGRLASALQRRRLAAAGGADRPRIDVPPFCALHQHLLVSQAGVGRDGPWRALLIMANIAMFQGATADPATHARLGNDITRLPEIGCLACYKPDRFGELVDAIQREGMGAIKPLGERWIGKGGER